MRQIGMSDNGSVKTGRKASRFGGVCRRENIKDFLSLPMNKSAEEIIQEHVASYNYPVAFPFPVAHQPPNLAFPHGGIGTLCVSNDKVSLIFEK
jgi:hypothetical protein